MNPCLSFGCSSALLLLTAVGQAQDEDWQDPARAAQAQRRSGFTIGMSGGLTLGRAYGYPNETDKIDRPQYEADTGLGIANGGILWLGGALTDWFTFGIGMANASLQGHDYQASGGAFVTRIEAFPLFYANDSLQDLGLALTCGAGTIRVERDGDTKADGGNMSSVGLGVFYEPWRAWQISLGPSLEVLYVFSGSLRSFSATLGGRIVFYGGP
ncbi:hypothetical protein ACFL5O_11565 [Myxococcota bacterium]